MYIKQNAYIKQNTSQNQASLLLASTTGVLRQFWSVNVVKYDLDPKV